MLGTLALAATACGDGATGGGGGGGDAGAEPWLHISPTWSSIYDGYFGPSGVAGCANGATCHSTASETGAVASNFICPDKDTCYQSLTGSSHLLRMQDVMNPAAAPFLGKLRQQTGMGRMPSNSMFTFQPQDVDVLKTWISKGAKND